MARTSRPTRGSPRLASFAAPTAPPSLRARLLNRARCAPRALLAFACRSSLPHRAARFSPALLLALLASLAVGLRLLRPPASPCSSRRPSHSAPPMSRFLAPLAELCLPYLAHRDALPRSTVAFVPLRCSLVAPAYSPALDARHGVVLVELCLPLRLPRSASSLIARRPSAILRSAWLRPLPVSHPYARRARVTRARCKARRTHLPVWCRAHLASPRLPRWCRARVAARRLPRWCWDHVASFGVAVDGTGASWGSVTSWAGL